MTAEDLIAMLQKCNPTDVVETWDPDCEMDMPVTGMTYGGRDGKITLYTDTDDFND